jgi:hypothetical protein
VKSETCGFPLAQKLQLQEQAGLEGERQFQLAVQAKFNAI